MRARTLAVMAVALAATLLGACAGDSGDSGGDAPSPGPTTGAPSAPPSTPGPVLPVPTPSLPPRNGELTITGEVVEGVERGCRLLSTDSGDYLLFGEPTENLPLGGTVTLRGQVRPDMMSTCQQGIPFEVLEVMD